MSNNLKAFILALLSGLLLWIAWPPHSLGWLSFIAFVPLLFIHDFYQKGFIRKFVFILLIYFSLLLWNIFTTWWIWNATPGGSIAAIVLNTLLMSSVWWVFATVSKKNNHKISYLFLISFWMAYELLHLNWEITWPWLVIGNVFANNTALVQWYEWTGHLGGSVWVLVVNVFIFLGIKKFREAKSIRKIFQPLSIIIMLPILVSFLILVIPKLKAPKTELEIPTLVIQPNLDPYSEKFSNDGNALSSNQQLDRMLQMAEEKWDSNTTLIVLPETALQGGILESDINNESLIIAIQDFVKKHPNINVVTGADSYNTYLTKETPTAHQYKNKGKFYDFYNTAFKIDNSANIEIYHKSRLVPGVEKLPYPFIFGGLVHLLDLDAQAGGLGTQKEASVFHANFNNSNINIAPLICYESVFGGYVREFVKKDANVLFVITNDGWWGNTDGYKQHLAYGRLRCIEFRKELIQCANTGLSAHLNIYGDIVKQTEWWKQEVLVANFQPNNTQTIYSRFGDYLGWIGVIISFSILVMGMAKRFRRP